MFTNDPTTVGYVKDTLPILSIYLYFDAVHGVNSGIVRALGKQFIASMVLLICYYVGGLPLALIFGFKVGMGVRGFWLGFLFALIVMDGIVSYLIFAADWSPLVQREENADSKKVEKDEDYKQIV